MFLIQKFVSFWEAGAAAEKQQLLQIYNDQLFRSMRVVSSKSIKKGKRLSLLFLRLRGEDGTSRRGNAEEEAPSESACQVDVLGTPLLEKIWRANNIN